jgi:hypothetical protein
MKQFTALNSQFTVNSQLSIHNCKLQAEGLLNAVNCKLTIGGIYE